MKQVERIKKIPPYIFAQIDEKKAEAKANGRTKDLVENPEGIDVALGDMGITERK